MSSAPTHRPWSPPALSEPFNPYDQLVNQLSVRDPSSSRSPHTSTRDDRREPSDASYEALDLADYAARLARQDGRVPNSQLILDYDIDLRLRPPPRSSLGGLSSSSRSRAPSSRPRFSDAGSSRPSASSSRGSRPSRKPRMASLPPSIRPTPQLGSTASVHRSAFDDDDPSIDVAHFPAWSRNWYAPSRPHLPQLEDGFEHPTKKEENIFDPGYRPKNVRRATRDSYDAPPSAANSDYGYGTSLPSYNGHGRPPGYGSSDKLGLHRTASLNTNEKEERLQMLQAEFDSASANAKVPFRHGDDGDMEEMEEDRVIGDVDSQGHLISRGPIKRKMTRYLQSFLTLFTLFGSIYIILKPQGRTLLISSYLSPLLSLISLALMLYFMVLRPRKARKQVLENAQNPFAAYQAQAMQLFGGQGADKKKRKKGKNGFPGMSRDVHLTLLMPPQIVPGVLPGMPGSFPGMPGMPSYPQDPSHKSRQRKDPQSLLAHENAWRSARSSLTVTSYLDFLLGVLWGALFVFRLIQGPGAFPSGSASSSTNTGHDVAPKVPPSAIWITLVTSACCMLCLAHVTSTVLGVMDLFASKRSPRTGV